MPLMLNGVEIDDLRVNGVQTETLFLNGTKVLDLTPPTYSIVVDATYNYGDIYPPSGTGICVYAFGADVYVYTSRGSANRPESYFGLNTDINRIQVSYPHANIVGLFTNAKTLVTRLSVDYNNAGLSVNTPTLKQNQILVMTVGIKKCASAPDFKGYLPGSSLYRKRSDAENAAAIAVWEAGNEPSVMSRETFLSSQPPSDEWRITYGILEK